jgi:hypothetical protein
VLRQYRCRALLRGTGPFAFIEIFHDRKRLRKHPHEGCLTPLEIRQRHEQGHALAA